ncbi:hypothetical protein IM538_05830 [Cytobacillus suaedae]|nr:hypothetical protein IM538_05830 [Cytobacillus suaedae]
MLERSLQINNEFFQTSEYAKKIVEELNNDAEGLIFDEFVHDIGAQLKIDVVYDKQSKSKWLLGEDANVKLYLEENPGVYTFTFIGTTPQGEQQIQETITTINTYS